MDNKAYLDEIAVKGKKKFSAGPILTPVMIKLIIVGVAAVIAMIVVATMLGSKKDDSAAIHENVYFRMTRLIDKKGPLATYIKKLKSSELRTYTSTLSSSLTTTTTSIKAVAGKIGLNTNSASGPVSSEINSLFTTLDSELDRAYLSGNLDVTYASSIAYQLALLISLETQARSKTSDATYAKTLDESKADLESLEESFRNYADTH
ncbi:hypothetical protein J5500_01455 [Candidatus Saccharibacteria bacterium]|nr:hypothetical protein [Candidatus Saccharibacteria bacterium]